MNSAVCFVASYAINAAWQVPVLAAAGFAASQILRRWGPQAQHVAWVSTFLISLITPALAALRALLPLAISWAYTPAKSGASVAIAETGAGHVIAAGTVLLPGAVIWLVFGLYVLALAWFVVRLLLSVPGMKSLMRGSAPLRLAAAGEEIWGQVRRAFAATDARLFSSESMRGIATMGARRPAIILPADFASRWAEDDLLSALGHELAHVRRHDFAKNLLYETAGLLTAFHPVSWMVKVQIARTREMACDAMVVESLVDRKRYRQSLLRLAERMMQPGRAATNALGLFDANILKERIMMLKLKRTVPNRLVRVTMTGSATLLLLATVVGGTAFAKGVAEQANDQTTSPNKVYKIGDGVTAPTLTWAPDPRYTNQARKAHYQGICVVDLIVGIDGRPRSVRVVRPLGMGLDENAVKAVKEYRFKPGMLDGKPVPVEINIEVNFRYY
jgi:TonB family protein